MPNDRRKENGIARGALAPGGPDDACDYRQQPNSTPGDAVFGLVIIAAGHTEQRGEHAGQHQRNCVHRSAFQRSRRWRQAQQGWGMKGAALVADQESAHQDVIGQEQARDRGIGRQVEHKRGGI